MGAIISECGKNELSIRQQIVALGESVAATLQPPSRRPIVATRAIRPFNSDS